MKLKKPLLIILPCLYFLFNVSLTLAQGVCISGSSSTAPDGSAILDLDVSALATKKGMLLPRMTLAQRSAIPTPATGLIIYQTDGITGLHYYNGSEWVNSMGWGLKGNVSTTAGTNFIGTTDNVDLVFKTNAVERFRILSGGQTLLSGGSLGAELRLKEPTASGGNYTAFRTQSQSSDITYILPAANGSAGQLLMNDGAGALAWATPSYGGTSVGSPSVISVSSGSVNNNFNIGSGNFAHISGSNSNFDITGIAGGTDGKIIVLYNSDNGSMRLKNENSGSSAENRILTLKAGGADATTVAQGVITLAYDGTAQRWIVIAVND